MFITVPILTPLSFIISLMYSQTIGPGPNSKKATNIQHITSSIVSHSLSWAIPVTNRQTEHAIVVETRIGFLPKAPRNPDAAVADIKLTAMRTALA